MGHVRDNWSKFHAHVSKCRVMKLLRFAISLYMYLITEHFPAVLFWSEKFANNKIDI